jgi:hypothetical protein
MKQVRIAATFFLLCFLLLVAKSSFASVAVGDDQPVFALGLGSIFSGQSVAQSFTLTSDTTVNQVDLGFLTFLLHSASGTYPFTIHITNGLAVGSQELLTLNETISLPLVSPDGQSTFSYGFTPITLAAGTYYLILTSPSSGSKIRLAPPWWALLGPPTSIMVLNLALVGRCFRLIARRILPGHAPPTAPWRSTWTTSSTPYPFPPWDGSLARECG